MSRSGSRSKLGPSAKSQRKSKGGKSAEPDVSLATTVTIVTVIALTLISLCCCKRAATCGETIALIDHSYRAYSGSGILIYYCTCTYAVPYSESMQCRTRRVCGGTHIVQIRIMPLYCICFHRKMRDHQSWKYLNLSG